MITLETAAQWPMYESFRYWFIPSGFWNAVDCIPKDKEEKPQTLVVSSEGGRFVIYPSGSPEQIMQIQADWENYLKRPESHLITEMMPNFKQLQSMDDAIHAYETLLVGCAYARAAKNGVDPDTAQSKVMKILGWIRSTDFYQAPASSRYHDSVPGGLLRHSLRVVEALVRCALAVSNKITPYSGVLCALVHDWCKIGCYEHYLRNVKNETTGQWEKVDSYRRREQLQFSYGHGVSSLVIASKFFNLTTEEALAVRWHMGEYNVAPNEMNELHQANAAFPLVYALQFADRLACTDYF